MAWESEKVRNFSRHTEAAQGCWMASANVYTGETQKAVSRRRASHSEKVLDWKRASMAICAAGSFRA
jgi:hypothetical protein